MATEIGQSQPQDEVEIVIDRFGQGKVTINGQTVPACCRVTTVCRVGRVPMVRLTLIPKKLRIKCERADVRQAELAVS